MTTYRCVQMKHAADTNTDWCRLINVATNESVVFTKDYVKLALQNGLIEVTNLILTKDNKLRKCKEQGGIQ